MRGENNYRRTWRHGRDLDEHTSRAIDGRKRQLLLDLWLASACVALAIAALRYLSKHKDRLLRRAARLSDYFAERLAQIEFKQRATVRIKGLAIGIDFEDEDYAAAVHEKSRCGGLLTTAA